MAKDQTEKDGNNQEDNRARSIVDKGLIRDVRRDQQQSQHICTNADDPSDVRAHQRYSTRGSPQQCVAEPSGRPGTSRRKESQGELRDFVLLEDQRKGEKHAKAHDRNEGHGSEEGRAQPRRQLLGDRY